MKTEIYPPLAIHQIGQRDNNEDAVYPKFGKATVNDKLFLVCDGVGGAAKGEVASQLHNHLPIFSRKMLLKFRTKFL